MSILTTRTRVILLLVLSILTNLLAWYADAKPSLLVSFALPLLEFLREYLETRWKN